MANTPLLGRTILVVDDEPLLRELIAEELLSHGATVLHAENGRVALELTQKHQVDAVVSDIRMPGGGGVELLEALRKPGQAQPPFILVTGFTDLTPDDAFLKGAEGILGKPFDPAALVRLLIRALLPSSERWTRKHERLPTDLPIALTIPPGRGETLEQRVGNIGQGGVFVRATGPLPETGTLVGFHLPLSAQGDPWIRGLGIIRWVGGENSPSGGYGLEFQALGDDETRRLNQYCDEIKSS